MSEKEKRKNNHQSNKGLSWFIYGAVWGFVIYVMIVVLGCAFIQAFFGRLLQP